MAQQAKLTVRKRAEVGRNAVKKIKAQGLVPGVIYGASLEPINLQVEGRALANLLAHASGENILVELEIVGDDKTDNALAMIQEVQHHPMKPDILHVDFHAVSATETVTAEVVIETVGEALGVKTYGGLLEHVLRYLEIEALPKDLPQLIEVDVTNLNVGESLHVRDLQLPPGVSAITDPDQTVVAISESRVEEEVEAPVEVAATPEVITAKKPEATPTPES